MAVIFPEDVDYGYDLSCLDDLTSAMTEVSGRVLLAQAIARRLQTPAGGLIDDPLYGYDVAGEIDNEMDDRTIKRIAARMDAEAVKDPRVLASETTATFINGSLTATMKLTDRAGPFALVLSISSVSVEVLKVAT